MRNVKFYTDSCFEYHKAIIASKNKTKDDPDYKNRVSLLNNDIENQYISFDDYFTKNELAMLSNLSYSGQNKTDLLSLYSYKSSVIQKLKTQITTSDTGRIINTCQNCTIGEINSFDHLVPKDEFPEFSVNPKNLFPSCTKCNSFKSSNWRDSGKNIFLNLYLDKLPEEQYLFVDITKSKGTFGTKFYLRNDGFIDEDLFTLIKFHYEKLFLFQRFSENNDLVITPLKNSIESYFTKLPLEEIKKVCIEISQKNQKAFGHNYWKSILEIALINDAEFMEQFH